MQTYKPIKTDSSMQTDKPIQTDSPMKTDSSVQTDSPMQNDKPIVRLKAMYRATDRKKNLKPIYLQTDNS
jgi:hypothetical protein